MTISGQTLEAALPAIPGFDHHQTTSLYRHELKSGEIQRVYLNPSGNSIFVAIADLGPQPKLYKNFITGGGLRQSSVGNSFGLTFRQASLQGSADYGLVLGQASPAFLGQISGVLGMAQASQPVQFSVVTQASPQASPQSSPQFSPQQFSPQLSPAQASPQFSPLFNLQFSPQISPQLSPQASPQFSPQASPQFSPQASPQFSPQASPQFSPQASPQFSPQLSPQFSPQASPQFSPQASPQFSPQVSPQFSPQGSQASVVFDASAFSAGQASAGISQVSAQLQRSGVDLKQLSHASQQSPFSLSEASGADGSFIRPFGLDTGHDVAGWELFDSRARIGTLILGMNDRIGILIEGTNVADPSALLTVASKIDYGALEKLMSAQK